MGPGICIYLLKWPPLADNLDNLFALCVWEVVYTLGMMVTIFKNNGPQGVLFSLETQYYSTGTPLLTRFLETLENRVSRKPRC